MTGRLVDTHLGSYDCKLNTVEGSHCFTTENKIYIKCRFFFYFGFRKVQNCSKIINILSPQVPFKMAPKTEIHPQVASWFLISSKVFIFKINTNNAGHIEPVKNSTAIIIQLRS